MRNGYMLAGFGDFESALSATEMLCESGFKVAYLNETKYVQESEIREFIRNFTKSNKIKFQNYHFSWLMQAKENAAESFKTAVEVLEGKSRHQAKYIVVVNTKEVTASKSKAVNVQ